MWNRFMEYLFMFHAQGNTNRNTRRGQRYELREAYSCYIELNETKNKAFSRPSRVYTTHVEVITFSFTAKDTRRQCQRHLSSGMYELFRCSHSALFLCLSCFLFMFLLFMAKETLLCLGASLNILAIFVGIKAASNVKNYWHTRAIHSPSFFYHLYAPVKNNDPFLIM